MRDLMLTMKVKTGLFIVKFNMNVYLEYSYNVFNIA